MSFNRRVPYSGKKKKQQLLERKQRKADKEQKYEEYPYGHRAEIPVLTSSLDDHFVLSSGNEPSSTDFGHDSKDPRTKRLISRFEKLSPEAIQNARLKSMQPFKRQPKTCLEVSVEDLQPYIDFPKRPKWDYNMNKQQVEEQEEKAFQEWKQAINEKYGSIYDNDDNTNNDSINQLSWYEQNLEVWRQLWRVLEISDVILLVMDIRNPLIHFPVPLYHYITKDLKRKMVGVFNKIDLVSDFTVFAWKKYFEEKFPELHISTFSCYPRENDFIDDTVTYQLKKRVKRPRKRYYSAQGVRDVLSCCKDVDILKHGVRVDWNGLIQRYNDKTSDHEVNDDNSNDDDSDTGSMAGLDDEFSGIMNITDQQVTPHHDYVTIGLVGHPNVGKSSLINSIMRRTVVSTSKTPGHTKHFQTIHLCENVRLCDSPGLVFPSLLPRSLQILAGMYPIAQVQEPYSVIQYLAERIPLENILSLTPPDLVDIKDVRSVEWSSWMICEAYAEQRGFHTAKGAQPDAYRAANAMLRLTEDGRILLSFKPPGFFETTKYEQLRIIEADLKNQEEKNDSLSVSDEDEDEDEDDIKPITTTNVKYSLLTLDDVN
ncbi:unnamed protein product [Cunninghamella blakesleeana]